MGAAKEQRGDALIRRQIDDEMNRLVSISARHLSEMHGRLAAYDRILDEKQTEINALRTELERAKGYIKLARIERDTYKAERDKPLSVLKSLLDCELFKPLSRRYALKIAIGRVRKSFEL